MRATRKNCVRGEGGTGTFTGRGTGTDTARRQYQDIVSVSTRDTNAVPTEYSTETSTEVYNKHSTDTARAQHTPACRWPGTRSMTCLQETCVPLGMGHAIGSQAPISTPQHPTSVGATQSMAPHSAQQHHQVPISTQQHPTAPNKRGCYADHGTPQHPTALTSADQHSTSPHSTQQAWVLRRVGKGGGGCMALIKARGVVQNDTTMSRVTHTGRGNRWGGSC